MAAETLIKRSPGCWDNPLMFTWMYLISHVFTIYLTISKHFCSTGSMRKIQNFLNIQLWKHVTVEAYISNINLKMSWIHPLVLWIHIRGCYDSILSIYKTFYLCFDYSYLCLDYCRKQQGTQKRALWDSTFKLFSVISIFPNIYISISDNNLVMK